MKCIGISWLALATTIRVFGQDAPSAFQVRSDARKDVAAQSSLPEKAAHRDVTEIARPNGSAEVVRAESGSSQLIGTGDQVRETTGSDEWIQDDLTEGKPSREVKKVAKARNQAKPEKLDRRSARGNGNNRPGARRPNGAGRPGGAGRPINRNR